MSGCQRLLIVAGLTLVTAGLLFGFVYGFVVEHGTLLVLKEAYGASLRNAAAGDWEASRFAFASGRFANYILVRAVDVHTHLIKMATLVLLLGLLWPLIRSRASSRAAAFVLGAVLFPAGVFAEIYTTSIMAKGLAALGAGIAILSLAAIFRGLLRPSESVRDRNGTAGSASYPA